MAVIVSRSRANSHTRPIVQDEGHNHRVVSPTVAVGVRSPCCVYTRHFGDVRSIIPLWEIAANLTCAVHSSGMFAFVRLH